MSESMEELDQNKKDNAGPFWEALGEVFMDVKTLASRGVS